MGTEGKINKFNYYTDLVLEAQRELKKRGFSRPGQPERFSRIDSMLSDASAYVADGSDEASGILSDLIREKNRGTLSPEQVKYLSKLVQEARAMGVFSRPGQPERFAANNVDLWNYFANLDFNFVKQGENGFAKYEQMAKKALTVPDFTPPAHRANGPSLHQMAKQALDDIKKHKWFSDMVWEQLVAKKLPAPILPQVSGASDTSNFDPYPDSLDAPSIPTYNGSDPFAEF
jgi:hypothetical protein